MINKKLTGLIAALLLLLPAQAAAPSKTQGSALLALQTLTSNTVLKSTAIDVSTKFGFKVDVFFARNIVTALSAGAIICVQTSAKSTGDDTWVNRACVTTGIATAESEAVTGTVASGQAVVTVASTTNLVVGDYIFIQNTTFANSEFCEIVAVSTNTSVTCMDNLTNAQTGSTLMDQGERYSWDFDASSVGRFRLVINGASTGQAINVVAFYSLLDSIG